MAEQFPVRVRGLAVAYNLAVMLFGGFAPFIVTWLTEVGAGPKKPPIAVHSNSCISSRRPRLGAAATQA
ncbi:hypothetical protein ACV35A_32145, partial [Pseudomonas aeruginosa]